MVKCRTIAPLSSSFKFRRQGRTDGREVFGISPSSLRSTHSIPEEEEENGTPFFVLPPLNISAMKERRVPSPSPSSSIFSPSARKKICVRCCCCLPENSKKRKRAWEEEDDFFFGSLPLLSFSGGRFQWEGKFRDLS